MVKITSGIQIVPGSEDVIVYTESGLSGTFTQISNRIHRWCNDQGIDADFITKWWDNDRAQDASVWRIINDQDRTMFVLQWCHRLHKL